MLLKKGNTGSAITVLQNILRELDYSVALTGTFDTATYNAIRNFQSSHHDEKKAPLHVDGQVGDMTWWALQDARPKVKKTVIPDKPNNNQQSAPQSLIDHLRLREGWRTKVYLDSLGKPTVGMGHLLTGKDINKYSVGVTIADNILTAWASADAEKSFNDSLQQASELTVSNSDFIQALASVIFQLGKGWNKKFKKTWALMKDRKWDEAALAVEKSLWFEQTPIRVRDFQVALRKLGSLK